MKEVASERERLAWEKDTQWTTIFPEQDQTDGLRETQQLGLKTNFETLCFERGEQTLSVTLIFSCFKYEKAPVHEHWFDAPSLKAVYESG